MVYRVSDLTIHVGNLSKIPLLNSLTQKKAQFWMQKIS